MQLFAGAVLAGSVIDLDGTIFIQFGIFFLTLFMLRSLVFKPVMALFDVREEAIDGARAEAKRMNQEAEQKGSTFEEEMRDVRLKAQADRDKLREEGARLERTILEKVHAETHEMLKEAGETLARERGKVHKELDTAVPALAREIASKLLGREVK